MYYRLFEFIFVNNNFSSLLLHHFYFSFNVFCQLTATMPNLFLRNLYLTLLLNSRNIIFLLYRANFWKAFTPLLTYIQKNTLLLVFMNKVHLDKPASKNLFFKNFYSVSFLNGVHYTLELTKRSDCRQIISFNISQ